MISAFNSRESRINIDDFASRSELDRGQPGKTVTPQMCQDMPVLGLLHVPLLVGSEARLPQRARPGTGHPPGAGQADQSSEAVRIQVWTG